MEAQHIKQQPRTGSAGAWGFRTAALGLLTLALIVFALLNLRQLWVYRQPTDGALLRRTTQGLTVVALDAHFQQQQLQRGDIVAAVHGRIVSTPGDVAQKLYASGIGSTLAYTIVRNGSMITVQEPVRSTRPPLGRYGYLEAIGLLYLAIGLFVFYRRRNAPQALNFYLFCLASFVLCCFHFTGKLNTFDQVVFWANEVALLAAPCLLVEFALRFPGRPPAAPRWVARFARLWLYAPAVLLGLAEVALATGALWLPVSVSAEQDVLNRAGYLLFAAYFLLAAWLFQRRSRAQAQADPRVGQQARIMAAGTLLALAPFLALYLVPYVLGADLPRFANASVVSLLLVPLAFGYAIWRHHLLEAEIVFRRGVVYTAATAAVVAVYWGVIGLAGILIHSRMPTWGWAGWLLAILVTALLFEPLKRWLQERLDRMFYRERYDYRRTLTDFARQINAQPDLERLLPTVLERLAQTLEVARLAVFLAPAPAAGGGFTLAGTRGLEAGAEAALDCGYLDAHFQQAGAGRLLLSHADAGCLDLQYFLPCQRQGRTVAVLGLGKTVRGEHLSGDDLELVETLAGHLGIAIENARLYATLRQKADEFQRLKDFNENIVESIQVGVVATDLEGRVESWNAQMEVLTARPRQLALGQALTDLLGEEFTREFASAAHTGGIHSHPKFRLSTPGFEDGADKIVNLAIAPLVTARFERVGHIVLLSDVTAEAEMEQRLIQADRLRSVGLLAAGVAHEVNTPLAVISSYAQLLAKQTPAGDPRARVLDTITRQTFRASEIIANLLHFSRTGAAQFRPVEVNTVLRDTLALIEHPLRSAGVHVIAALHPTPITVTGDAGKLQQVFLNLALNARDAMPQGGTLRIATGFTAMAGSSEARAWIEVSDSGEGIAPELHHRIFDPFFTTKAGRGSSFTTAPGATMSTGTGLGLAVTYGIVAEHGGTIHVLSEPQRGATFRVQLPLRAPEVELAALVAV